MPTHSYYRNHLTTIHWYTVHKLSPWKPFPLCKEFKYCLAAITMETVSKHFTDKQFIKLSPTKPFSEYNDVNVA